MKKSVIKETVDKERDFFFSFTECLGNTSKQGDFFLFFGHTARHAESCSQTRDGTSAPCSGIAESQPRDPQGSHTFEHRSQRR